MMSTDCNSGLYYKINKFSIKTSIQWEYFKLGPAGTVWIKQFEHIAIKAKFLKALGN